MRKVKLLPLSLPKNRISVVVASHNEGKLLDACLAQVADWADELVVFDMGSTDETAAVAKKYRAKLILRSPVPYIELARNKMVESCLGPWVLVLDPDERLTASLKRRLLEIVEQDLGDAVNIPRKNIFFGRWIAHTNWWPDRHTRFFKKGKVFWSKYIHIYPRVLSQRILNLPAKEDLAIVHYGYKTLTQFFTRQNRYSEVEAQNRHELGEKFSWWKFFWWPAREFLARYIKHEGFLDGFYGLALVILMMIYRLSVWVKIWEIEHK